MALNPPNTEFAAEADFAAVLKRFVTLNDLRLARTRDALRRRQRDFLDLLPIFFHINHPLLPGYRKDCPAGVSGYSPDSAALEAAMRLCSATHFHRELHRETTIQAIYLMGSPGSLAYTGDSDFDVWLCHDPVLDGNRLTSLREKADAVQVWAASLDLEVHIFLVRPDQFRRGEAEALSEQGSGSAQRHLLLDEFYRTGLRLAGMYPLWWLVPPEREADYDRYVDEILYQRHVKARNLIDFGGLGNVPAGEFLGAAVWQLYKGIDSPHKSVLKLLLIESYARNYPHLDLLALRFKQAVYRGKLDPDRLDPYLMMLDKVEEDLKERNENERLNLARRCFYFKVDEKLSDDDPTVARWRRDLLGRRARDWGWSRADMVLLDGRHGWKVDKIAEERRLLFKALSESYRFLSGFARRHAGSALISQCDLNILGRKLYSAFERKAGKVDLLGSGFATNRVEHELTVHELTGDVQGAGRWVLYRGVVKPEEVHAYVPVRRFHFIVELVAWCYFNGVIDKTTQVLVFTRSRNPLGTPMIKAMIGRMYALFPDRAAGSGAIADFAEPAHLVQTALFLNAGVDALARSRQRGGHMASGCSDALCYSALRENRVHTVDQVVVTSWREVHHYHFSGAEGLMDCLCETLKWAPLSSGIRPTPPSVLCLDPGNGSAIARRVADLLRDVIDCYYSTRRAAPTRYVVAVEQGYYALGFDGDMPRYQRLDGQAALLRYLSAPQREFSPVVFDRHVQEDRVLPLIFSHNRPGVVQLFYRVQGALSDAYVLDERGSLFWRRTPFHDADALLAQYGRFLETVLNRMNFQMQDSRPADGTEGLEFFKLDSNGAGGLCVLQQRPRFKSSVTPFISLQVIVDVDEAGRTLFTLDCNGREFCSPESGGRALDEVVSYVLELRRERQSYPIYITDISMSPAVLGREGVERIQTIHFLSYKHRIEEKLNESLARRQGRDPRNATPP